MKKTFLSVHPSFFLLMLIGYFTNTIFQILAVYLCLLIHECGHIIAARAFKINVSYIKVMPFGIAIRFKNESTKDVKTKFIIAAAGPVFSIAAGFIFKNDFLRMSNFALGFFNLLPILTLDGGRLFFISVSAIFGSINGYNILKATSAVFSVLLFVLGGYAFYITHFNVSLVLVSAFLMYRLVSDGGYEKMTVMQNVLDYKQKKCAGGIYRTKQIGISESAPLRRILKHLPYRKICIINILDDKLHLVGTISEETAVDMMLKYGAGASYKENINEFRQHTIKNPEAFPIYRR